MGDIGEGRRTIEMEPLDEPATVPPVEVPETVPAEPEKEPVPG